MPSLPQEVSAAAHAHNEALSALQVAQTTFDAQDAIVQSLVQAQQQAVFDAQVAFIAAGAALDSARATAQLAVPGWVPASSALQSATSIYSAARVALANLLDGEASPPEPV